MAKLEYWPCYFSYSGKVAKLSDQEVGRLFRALMQYAETGEPQELTGRESIAYDFIAYDIDRAKEAYEETCRRNRENGQKSTTGTEGGRPGATGTDGGRPVPTAPQYKYKDKDKYKTKSKDEKEEGAAKSPQRSPRFVPPSVEEVRAYCQERHNSVDPEAFVAFYASKGWKVGNTPMKDWRAAVLTWEKRDAVEKPDRKKGGWSFDDF